MKSGIQINGFRWKKLSNYQYQNLALKKINIISVVFYQQKKVAKNLWISILDGKMTKKYCNKNNEGSSWSLFFFV